MSHDNHLPLVSVVMPVFDGLPHLAATLAAVDDQRNVRLQRIAVDDGSSDGSRRLLERTGRWLVRATDRVGPNVARATGLREVDGEYVVLLDQDDIWHPTHLDTSIAALRTHPEAGAVVASRQVFRNAADLRLGGVFHGPHRFDPWAVFPVNVIDTPSMVVARRQALQRAGGWPVDRRLGADALAWWRLSADSPLAISRRRTVGVRRTEGTFSAAQRRSPASYARQLATTAADALTGVDPALRAAVGPGGMTIMRSIVDLVESAVDGGDVRAGLERFRAALAGRTDPVAVATIGHVGWLLDPCLKGFAPLSRDPAEALLTAAAGVDRFNRRVRQMVAAVAGPARLLGITSRHPLSRTAWSCLGNSLLFRAASASGRIADPLMLPFGDRPCVRGSR